jgi:phosphoglycerol transferase MdoB-like AlkP superfamily enzyme
MNQDANTCQPYNLCFYSSFVFIINVLVASYYGYYLYAGLFFALLITSLLHHSHYNQLTNILDKIVIYCIVFYGGYLFYKKLKEYIDSKNEFTAKEYLLSAAIIITFLSTIFLYYYGYLNTCLCFSDDQTQAYLFHSFMHCVSSFGHCCVVFL